MRYSLHQYMCVLDGGSRQCRQPELLRQCKPFSTSHRMRALLWRLCTVCISGCSQVERDQLALVVTEGVHIVQGNCWPFVDNILWVCRGINA
jgi:hypothetical protein